MAYYCNGKKGICDKISSSLGICPDECEFMDGTGGYNVAVPMPKHLTNADHIRAMSDEELCEFLSQYSFFEMCKDEGCDACSYKGDCDKRLLEWLKAPYKENEE